MLPAFWELDAAAAAAASDGGATAATASSAGSVAAWLQAHVAASAAASKLTATTAQTTLYHNLVAAVTALTVVEAPKQELAGDNDDGDDDEVDEPRKKKRKAAARRLLHDPCRIWFQTAASQSDAAAGDDDDGGKDGALWDEDQDDIPDTAGGKLAVLSVGGLLNGLAGQRVCRASNANPKTLLKQAVASGLADRLARTLGGGATVLQLHATATSLHVAIADRVKLDILRTTPHRIQLLLAADLTPAEFTSVRRRLYDTVILGKGMHHADDTGSDLPTAASGSVHDMERFKKCHGCGNNDQSEFILDPKNADLICATCGTVVSESIMHEGSQFRKFEGEVDRNHHGDAGNPLYSNAHNMGTSLSGVAPTTGAGLGGWGSGGGGGGGQRNLETILKNAHAYTELNVSQFGKTDRRTRVGYKDRQKKDAFLQMSHAGDALNLHEAVVQRAKELFAGKTVAILWTARAREPALRFSPAAPPKVFGTIAN